jgi:hypothetical protein
LKNAVEFVLEPERSVTLPSSLHASLVENCTSEDFQLANFSSGVVGVFERCVGDGVFVADWTVSKKEGKVLV